MQNQYYQHVVPGFGSEHSSTELNFRGLRALKCDNAFPEVLPCPSSPSHRLARYRRPSQILRHVETRPAGTSDGRERPLISSASTSAASNSRVEVDEPCRTQLLGPGAYSKPLTASFCTHNNKLLSRVKAGFPRGGVVPAHRVNDLLSILMIIDKPRASAALLPSLVCV